MKHVVAALALAAGLALAGCQGDGASTGASRHSGLLPSRANQGASEGPVRGRG